MKTCNITDLDAIIKDNFPDENIDKNVLAKKINQSIKTGENQFENSEYMSLEESQKLINDKFFGAK